MRPAKTDQAREALRMRSGGLGAIERHVLIVSDGERTDGEIVAMLGDGARQALDRLLRAGYLLDATAPVAAMSPPPAGVATPRRSLVAAKLYMVDMLQLQRDPASSAIAARLRESRDADDVARALADALAHLRLVATPSYVERVGARLAEVAPVDLLAFVDARRADPSGARAA